MNDDHDRLDEPRPACTLPANRDLFYGGDWQPAQGGYANTRNPATGESLGRCAVANAADVDAAAVQRFKPGFPPSGRRRWAPSFRVRSSTSPRPTAPAPRVDTGYVWINATGRHFPGAPFGGYKQSGQGREESFDELLSYTQVKNVHIAL